MTVTDLRATIAAVRDDGKNRMAQCPAHPDACASLSVGRGEKRIVLNCKTGCTFADIKAAAGLDSKDLALARPASTEYLIRDLDGSVVAIHERLELPAGKKFVWRQPDGTSGLNGKKVIALPLYNTHHFRTWPAAAPIVITEGEGCADALVHRGFAAVGTVTGAGSCPQDQLLRVLIGHPVILWPDADEPGVTHMRRIATRLQAIGVTDIRIITWPDAPAGGDVLDYPGDVSALIAAAGPMFTTTTEAAPPVEPATSSAAVPPLADILDTVYKYLTSYVVLTPDQAVAIVLWTAHTHAIDAADCTPYIQITSVTHAAGKTRTLEVLEQVVARSWLTGRTSAAALVRKTDRLQPTLLLDESDAAFNGEPEYSEALRGLLNSGYRRSGRMTMCAGQGANLTFQDFATFSAKAIAGIGKLPDTVASRSIRIELKRRTKDEHVEKFRQREAAAEAKAIHMRLAAWAVKAVPVLHECRPAMPAGLSDRAEEVLEPLLAIADLAGARWAALAHTAAVALMGEAQHDDINIELLHDIQAIFDAESATFIASDLLLEKLRAIEGHPWSDWRGGKPMSARALSDHVKLFGVIPKSNGEKRGYDRARLEDAWKRYPVPDPGSNPSTRQTANENGPEPAKSTRQADPATDGLKSEKTPMNTGGIDGLTGCTPDHEPTASSTPLDSEADTPDPGGDDGLF